MSYAAIGKEMNCSDTVAYKLVRKAIKAIPLEAATQVRAQDLEALSRQQARLESHADAGDVHAALGVVRILERRSKYYGLDAATKVEAVTMTVEQRAKTLFAPPRGMAIERVHAIARECIEAATDDEERAAWMALYQAIGGSLT